MVGGTPDFHFCILTLFKNAADILNIRNELERIILPTVDLDGLPLHTFDPRHLATLAVGHGALDHGAEIDLSIPNEKEDRERIEGVSLNRGNAFITAERLEIVGFRFFLCLALFRRPCKTAEQRHT